MHHCQVISYSIWFYTHCFRLWSHWKGPNNISWALLGPTNFVLDIFAPAFKHQQNTQKPYWICDHRASEVQLENSWRGVRVIQKTKGSLQRRRTILETKNRTAWHAKGSKFYYALTKQRRIKNKILELCNSKGNWVQ